MPTTQMGGREQNRVQINRIGKRDRFKRFLCLSLGEKKHPAQTIN